MICERLVCPVCDSMRNNALEKGFIGGQPSRCGNARFEVGFHGALSQGFEQQRLMNSSGRSWGGRFILSIRTSNNWRRHKSTSKAYEKKDLRDQKHGVISKHFMQASSKMLFPHHGCWSRYTLQTSRCCPIDSHLDSVFRSHYRSKDKPSKE